MSKRIVAGCMTGTSLDGLDIAVVEISGSQLEMGVEVLRVGSRPLRELGAMLKPITRMHRTTAAELVRLGTMLGKSHAIEIKKLIESDLVLDMVVVHGQTIFHEPPDSFQLINPWPIAHELNCRVVYDLRAADIAAGGQGAPMTPIADHILFRDEVRTRVIVNLGGFVNYTWMPAGKKSGAGVLDSIRGGDVCACNQLLDEIAEHMFGMPYDDAGINAGRGRIDPEAYELLLMTLNSQADSARSLGTGDEAREWITMFQHRVTGYDMARTACAAIAQVLVHAVGEVQDIVLAGGGVKNLTLLREIADRTDAEVMLSDDLGVSSTHREAISMAILGALCEDKVPITLPQVTGCGEPAPVAGCWIFPPQPEERS